MKKIKILEEIGKHILVEYLTRLTISPTANVTLHRYLEHSCLIDQNNKESYILFKDHKAIVSLKRNNWN
jgi:hypothetical protein